MSIESLGVLVHLEETPCVAQKVGRGVRHLVAHDEGERDGRFGICSRVAGVSNEEVGSLQGPGKPP